jgi:hypothetical protein
VKTKKPEWIKPGVMAVYNAKTCVTRYEGATVEIVASNRHGRVTIRFLGGPRTNQTRGVLVRELSPATAPPA